MHSARRTSLPGPALLGPALLALAAGCGPAELDVGDDAEEQEGQIGAAATTTVSRLAPAVYLHSSEAYRPMSAATFLSRSRLRWSHDAACPDHQLAGTGEIRAASLGSGAYGHQTAGNILCGDSGRRYASNEKVRPRDGVTGTEGMFLDMDNGARGGSGTSAPVYYEYVRGSFVTYWFLYGNSQPPGPSLITERLSHEGDWERVSVRLDGNDQPTDVAFYAHNGYCTLPWSRVAKQGGHPVVYSGKGSHASYATAGSHPVSFAGLSFSDETNRGAAWSTWQSLFNARAQGWYGFGGAWGEVGELKDTTGPLGPSVHKGSAPGDWSPRCS